MSRSSSIDGKLVNWKLTRRALLQMGLVATGSLIIACAPKATPEPAEAESAEPEAATATPVPKAPAEAVPTERAIEIEYWCGGGEQRMNFYMTEVIPPFQDLYPNISVKLGNVPSWADLYNKLVTSAAGGAPPELCRQKDYFTPDFAVRGVQMDLTDYIATAEHLTDTSIWIPYAWQNCLFEGKPHALPINVFIHYPHYSLELFTKAGLVDTDGVPIAPDTWEEFAETAKKLSDPTKNVYGCMLRSENLSEDTTNFFHVLLAQAGGRLHDASFEKFTFNSEEGLDVLKWVIGMIEDGAMKPVGVEIPDIIYNNQVGMHWSAMNYWPGFPEEWKFCTSVNPKRATRGAVLRGNHLALYTEAKERDAGWLFMAFHETPEIDYAYGKSQCFITAQVANHSQPFYHEPWKGNACALPSLEFDVINDPGTQPQAMRPGYQEAALKIAAQLQLAYMGEIAPEEALEIAEREGNQVLEDTNRQLGK